MRTAARLLAILAVLALVAAACNNNGTTTTTDDADQGPPAAQDGNGDGTDASAAAGSYSGTWNNTTFGSSGAARIDIQIDGSTATFTTDLDGNVFGQSDPDAVIYTGTVTADGMTFTTPSSPLFGNMTLVVNADGSFTLTGDDPPADGIAKIEAQGSISESGIGGTYTVTFDDGTTAEGTFSLTKG